MCIGTQYLCFVLLSHSRIVKLPANESYRTPEYETKTRLGAVQIFVLLGCIPNLARLEQQTVRYVFSAHVHFI